ncbi:uncharacterized protein LOC130818741 isoform X2 [Amaranthus tricolor]|uniref:uncharacterized protein LOC130818741 isoform X2 n=1 Tax=Amaranthus tricolor TaxID=29722 RepID=UPI00258F70A6|nr:uncharacterized protein LOC130818741 isoform X2 [Amaranthus tricolor]
MEKISAACAMSWSIELEIGLRSRKPGKAIGSINMIGRRLKQWNREPLPTMAAYNMYGLVLGEDRLFADAILLRLVDAFVSGDKDIKISVIRVFLTLRHSKTQDRETRGIFSDMSEENKLELLRRVKVVLSSDIVEFRALALILLGCCAEIAKDVAEIRYAILSSLSSSYVLEAKASLFAAGNFSEISDDFGSVFLDSLLKLMNSPKTLQPLRKAAARSFSKMGCSLLLAISSYKAGVELVRNTSEEDILATMLVSLTKLSSKAPILILEQVDLLNSFLAQRTSLRLLATVLRCMHNVGEQAAWFLPISASPFKNLFQMLDELNMPSALQDDVLQLLLKMLDNGLPDVLFNDIDDFMKLLRYVEDATCSLIVSTKILAFQILVSVSIKLKGEDDQILEVNSVAFTTKVVSTISDQITLLVKLVRGGTSRCEVEQELGSMLKLLLILVQNHSELGCFILDKLHFVIKNMENSENMPSASREIYEVHKVVNAGEIQNCPIRVFMTYIYRFLVAFLETLDGFGSTTTEIVDKFKQLVSFVCDSCFFDCSTHTFFALLLHSLLNWSFLPSENQSSNSVQGLRGSYNFPEDEALIHRCAKNMLLSGDNWCAYKAGRYACCEGEWYMANFIFQHLEAKAQSDVCCHWLKFLVQFTHSEKKVKVLLQQSSHCSILDHVLVPSAMSSIRNTISNEYIKALVSAFGDVSSYNKVLEAISLQTQTLCFQRWFLALRLKVLLALLDVLKVLNVCLVSKVDLEGLKNTGGSEFIDVQPVSQRMEDIIPFLNGISAKLASVAEEYDLISTAFVDLDSKSLRVISDLAYSCSMLAFSTELTSLICSAVSSGLTDKSNYRQSAIIKDLTVRLWHVDFETCMDLMSLLNGHGGHKSSSHLLPGFQISKIGRISEHMLTLCKSSMRQLVGLLNECSSIKNENTVYQVYKDSMQILLSITGAWMHIPFRVPKYFFRLRPTVGALLFSKGAGSSSQNEAFVSQGSHLALNLCIQLHNVNSDVCSRFSKIHIILSCKNRHTHGEGWTSYQASETDTMVDLNKKLRGHVLRQDHQNDGESVEVFVRFKTNGRAQGFSSCLLNVSTFPIGSYRIQWHCGGVDHQGVYSSFLPLSPCPQFRVIESSSESLLA